MNQTDPTAAAGMIPAAILYRAEAQTGSAADPGAAVPAQDTQQPCGEHSGRRIRRKMQENAPMHKRTHLLCYNAE